MNTRDRIVESARGLVQRRSFHGFSFQDIADEVGIRKASLYHHFDSKDAVAIAMLDQSSEWVRTQLKKTDGRAPSERLEGYFAMFRLLHGKAERMCPGGSFASVYGAISSSLQTAVHRFGNMHLDWVEGVVRDGVEQGEFDIGDQRPRDVAAQIVSGIQGALLMGRLTSDPHILDAVADGFTRSLGYAAKATDRASQTT